MEAVTQLLDAVAQEPSATALELRPWGRVYRLPMPERTLRERVTAFLRWPWQAEPPMFGFPAPPPPVPPARPFDWAKDRWEW